MKQVIIDLQQVCENTDNLPSEAQIQAWANRAISQNFPMLK